MRSATPARTGRTSPLGIPSQEAMPAERMVFTEADLASRWGMSPKTLQPWRTEGRGPHYLRLGKRVTYTINVHIPATLGQSFPGGPPGVRVVVAFS